MSDSAAYSESGFGNMSFADFGNFDFVPEGRGTRKRMKDKRVFILRIIVLVLCFLLLGEGVVHFILVPTLEPVKIQFNGVKNLTAEQLAEKVNEIGGPTWMQFDTAKAVFVLSAISSIEQVSVDKHFPDKVYIQIKEREPVVKTIVMQDGRSLPVQIDKNGVLFTAGAASVSKSSSIPLVSGLPVDQVQDGMRLPAKYRSLLDHVSVLQGLDQNYFAAISEIQVVPKEYGNYELILYPIHTNVRVLADRSLDEDALKYMMVMLDVVKSIGQDVNEIDLRYGAVSYRRR